jgi:magnesium transporter
VFLTIRFYPHPAFDTAHDSCHADPTKGAEDSFLRIIEQIVDRAADKLEHAGAECDDLARVIRNGTSRSAVAGNLSAALRRVNAVSERAPVINPTRMKSIRADVASLTEYEGHLSGRIQFLLDATLGFINIEQNEIVKTLTIASVVGIPPVLVAGIYGMNFHYMPELGWLLGYPMALGLIVVSAIVPIFWFKKRGWM